MKCPEPTTSEDWRTLAVIVVQTSAREMCWNWVALGSPAHNQSDFEALWNQMNDFDKEYIVARYVAYKLSPPPEMP